MADTVDTAEEKVFVDQEAHAFWSTEASAAGYDASIFANNKKFQGGFSLGKLGDTGLNYDKLINHESFLKSAQQVYKLFEGENAKPHLLGDISKLNDDDKQFLRDEMLYQMGWFNNNLISGGKTAWKLLNDKSISDEQRLAFLYQMHIYNNSETTLDDVGRFIYQGVLADPLTLGSLGFGALGKFGGKKFVSNAFMDKLSNAIVSNSVKGFVARTAAPGLIEGIAGSHITQKVEAQTINGFQYKEYSYGELAVAGGFGAGVGLGIGFAGKLINKWKKWDESFRKWFGDPDGDTADEQRGYLRVGTEVLPKKIPAMFSFKRSAALVVDPLLAHNRTGQDNNIVHLRHALDRSKATSNDHTTRYDIKGSLNNLSSSIQTYTQRNDALREELAQKQELINRIIAELTKGGDDKAAIKDLLQIRDSFPGNNINEIIDNLKSSLSNTSRDITYAQKTMRSIFMEMNATHSEGGSVVARAGAKAVESELEALEKYRNSTNTLLDINKLNLIESAPQKINDALQTIASSINPDDLASLNKKNLIQELKQLNGKFSAAERAMESNNASLLQIDPLSINKDINPKSALDIVSDASTKIEPYVNKTKNVGYKFLDYAQRAMVEYDVGHIEHDLKTLKKVNPSLAAEIENMHRQGKLGTVDLDWIPGTDTQTDYAKRAKMMGDNSAAKFFEGHAADYKGLEAGKLDSTLKEMIKQVHESFAATKKQHGEIRLNYAKQFMSWAALRYSSNTETMNRSGGIQSTFIDALKKELETENLDAETKTALTDLIDYAKTVSGDGDRFQSNARRLRQRITYDYFRNDRYPGDADAETKLRGKNTQNDEARYPSELMYGRGKIWGSLSRFSFWDEHAQYRTAEGVPYYNVVYRLSYPARTFKNYVLRDKFLRIRKSDKDEHGNVTDAFDENGKPLYEETWGQYARRMAVKGFFFGTISTPAILGWGTLAYGMSPEATDPRNNITTVETPAPTTSETTQDTVTTPTDQKPKEDKGGEDKGGEDEGGNGGGDSLVKDAAEDAKKIKNYEDALIKARQALKNLPAKPTQAQIDAVQKQLDALKAHDEGSEIENIALLEQIQKGIDSAKKNVVVPRKEPKESNKEGKEGKEGENKEDIDPAKVLSETFDDIAGDDKYGRVVKALGHGTADVASSAWDFSKAAGKYMMKNSPLTGQIIASVGMFWVTGKYLTSLLDSTVGKIPLIGGLLSGILGIAMMIALPIFAGKAAGQLLRGEGEINDLVQGSNDNTPKVIQGRLVEYVRAQKHEGQTPETKVLATNPEETALFNAIKAVKYDGESQWAVQLEGKNGETYAIKGLGNGSQGKGAHMPDELVEKLTNGDDALKFEAVTHNGEISAIQLSTKSGENTFHIEITPETLDDLQTPAPEPSDNTTEYDAPISLYGE